MEIVRMEKIDCKSSKNTISQMNLRTVVEAWFVLNVMFLQSTIIAIKHKLICELGVSQNRQIIYWISSNKHLIADIFPAVFSKEASV